MIVEAGPILRIAATVAGAATPDAGLAGASARKLRDVERDHLLRVLGETGWRIRGRGGAAEILGLKPTTLEARIARLGIRRPHG